MPAALDTVACAYAASGDFAKALTWQTKAIELADQELKDDMTTRLKLYKAGKPYVEEKE